MADTPVFQVRSDGTLLNPQNTPPGVPEGWQGGSIGIPADNPVVKAIDTVATPLFGSAQAALTVSKAVLTVIEQYAPLLGSASNAVTRTSIEFLRDTLREWQVGGHLIVVDVPYGITYPGPNPVDVVWDRAKASWGRFTDDPAVLESLTRSRPKGKKGLTTLLVNSVNDRGDANRPLLSENTSFVGVSLVLGSDTGADLDKLVESFGALMRLLKAFLPGLKEYGSLSTSRMAPPEIMPQDFEVVKRGSDYYAYWKDSIQTYPQQLESTAHNGTVTYNKPPFSVEIFWTLDPAKAFSDPQDGGWTELWVSTAGIRTETGLPDKPSVALRYERGGRYTWALPPDLAAKWVDSNGAPVTAYLAIRHVYAIADVAGAPAGTGINSPWARASYVPAPPVTFGVAVPPDWNRFSTLQAFDGTGDAGVGFLDQLEHDFLKPFEDGLQDGGAALAKLAAITKRRVEEVERVVAQIKAAVDSIKALLQAVGGVYFRPFQYVVTPGQLASPLAVLDPTIPAPPTGPQALISEYQDSLSKLPFESEDALLFGAFLVIPLPSTLSARYAPLRKAIDILLSLWGLSLDGFVSAGQTWHTAQNLQQTFGGMATSAPPDTTPTESGPPYAQLSQELAAATAGGTAAGTGAIPIGAQDLGTYSGGAPVPPDGFSPGSLRPPLGETESQAVSEGRVLDLNCPPDPDLTDLSFADNLKPIKPT